MGDVALLALGDASGQHSCSLFGFFFLTGRAPVYSQEIRQRAGEECAGILAGVAPAGPSSRSGLFWEGTRVHRLQEGLAWTALGPGRPQCACSLRRGRGSSGSRVPAPPRCAPPAAGQGERASGFSLNMEDEFFGEKSFQHYCAEFIKHSQQIGDGWEWKTAKDCSDGYMCKTQFQIKHGTTTSHLGIPASVHTCLPVEENLELPADDSEAMESASPSEVIKYEYHVLYSCSYQVPVLYFRASFLDGRPLALKDIWEGVHECYKTRLLQGPWDTITQQEHPILGQPFFVLHPCKTNEFMTAVLKNPQEINRNVNYITSWLSIVGPVVGLNLPLSYAKAASQDE